MTMASLNQCNFIGRVGKIDTRYLSNGDTVTNLSLAVDESYKDKNGNKVDKVEWIDVVLYKKLAEIAGKYVSKGSLILIIGKHSKRKYTDKNGIERYPVEIIASSMQMLGNKQGDSSKSEASNNDSGDSDIPF